MVDISLFETTVEIVSKTRNHLPAAKYPGITRVLDHTSDKSKLDEWRMKVGAEEADRITHESTVIGKSLDELVMKSFRSDFNRHDFSHVPGYQLYTQIEPVLKNVVPAAMQVRLWSDRIKLKGFPDIIGWYKGVFSIIDIKNTRKTKQLKYIENYFIQCTAYSIMLYEMTGLEAKQVVIIMGDRSSVAPQVFSERTANYVAGTVSRVKTFHKLNIDYEPETAPPVN